MRLLSWLDGLHLDSPRRRPERGRPRGSAKKPPGAKLFVEPLECRTVPAFLAPVEYAAGSSPVAVVAADINGDHKLDLAVANYSSGTVSVLLGNGDGTFQPAKDSDAGGYPLSLAVGDFNGDGKPDLATTNNVSEVTVLMGNGDGTFQPASGFAVAGDPPSVAVGDFNGDGKMDIGFASNNYVIDGYYIGDDGGYYPIDHYEGYANVLLGNGDGTFAGPNVTYLGVGYREKVAAADLNGDGLSDLAAVNVDYGTVGITLGNADGYLHETGDVYAGSGAVAAGDVNGDNIPDLASNGGVLLGNGDGTFQAVQNFATGGNTAGVVLGDFTGDGKIDVATANLYFDTGFVLYDYGTVSVFYGAGNGTFSAAVNTTLDTAPFALTAGDFNGDGAPDVATANYFGTGNVSVLINDLSWPPFGAPSVSINDVTVTEGNTGTTNATFTLSLSAAYTQDVTVHWSTADGTATAGSDYQAASGTLTIPAGQTTGTITVLVNGDRVAEPNETFVVNLSAPANASIADGKGVGTIVDDEPRIGISDVTRTEGSTGTTLFAFTVSLSAACDAPVTVNFATADGSATAGSDYQATSGTLTIPAGQTTGTITVLVNGDRLAEPNEAFTINLSNPVNAGIADGQGVGTIVDDEPRISIHDVARTEGNTGMTPFVFTVSLWAAYDIPVTVSFATANGSATAGSDYQATSGTLTIPAGQTTGTISVLVNGDRLPEPNETFFVTLSNLNYGVIAGSWATGTILDDEPRISIGNVAKAEGRKNQTTLFTFTVTLSVAYDEPVTVSYRTTDGTATASDSDYVAKTGTITFLPGETTKTITIEVKGDSKKEADEYFYLDLFGNSSNSLFTNTPTRGIGTILNDD